MADYEKELRFEKYYKKQAVEFLIENSLGIQTEYEFNDAEKYGYIVVSVSALREQKPFKVTSSFKTEEELLRQIKVDNVYFKDYGKKFFEKLYLNANEDQKKYIHEHSCVLYALDNYSEALSVYPEKMIEYVKSSKKIHNQIKNSWVLNGAVECWKKSLTEEQFNDLVLDYFTFYKKEGKKDKTRINMEYVFHTYIEDDETFNKLKDLLPITDQTNENDIFNEKLNTFEIAVDKAKLAQYIRLENNEEYISMYEHIASFFDGKDILKELKVIRIKKEEKFKSAKDYHFLVRAEKNSLCTKDMFKKILLTMFKEYERTMQSHENKWEAYKLIRDEWTTTWFKKVILDSTLESKSEVKTKKMKI